MSEKRVKIGILGYGTVSKGVVKTLTENHGEILRRCGYHLDVKSIARRSWQHEHFNETPSFACLTDCTAVVNDPEIEIVLELMGGLEPARQLILQAITQGKHVITANKALIAAHGDELFEAARARGVELAYEAAVAGGIPIIKVLREAMTGNRISRVAGIINGTCNFILSAMHSQHREFQDVLAEAQKLGYAEADPSFDVEGIDAAHKLTILSAIAFGIPMQLERVHVEGITRITPQDLRFAEELGYRIKHLGLAIRREEGVELRVHPSLIRQDALLAHVDGVMNAVVVQGNAIGQSLYYGPGAGMLPTASAVVADLIDTVRELNLSQEDRLAEFGFVDILPPEALPVLCPKDYVSAYYLRITADDKVGVLADIARIFADCDISIESILQKHDERSEGCIPVILLTQRIRETQLEQALQMVRALPHVHDDIMRIRITQI